jgi:hypothetical protein
VLDGQLDGIMIVQYIGEGFQMFFFLFWLLGYAHRRTSRANTNISNLQR